MTFGDIVAVDGGELSLINTLDGGELSLSINIDGGEVGTTTTISDYPTYSGPYEVDPIFERITLETAHKVMGSDVQVNAIQVHRVSNPQGGITVTIGYTGE